MGKTHGSTKEALSLAQKVIEKLGDKEMLQNLENLIFTEKISVNSEIKKK